MTGTELQDGKQKRETQYPKWQSFNGLGNTCLFQADCLCWGKRVIIPLSTPTLYTPDIPPISCSWLLPKGSALYFNMTETPFLFFSLLIDSMAAILIITYLLGAVSVCPEWLNTCGTRSNIKSGEKWSFDEIKLSWEVQKRNLTDFLVEKQNASIWNNVSLLESCTYFLKVRGKTCMSIALFFREHPRFFFGFWFFNWRKESKGTSPHRNIPVPVWQAHAAELLFKDMKTQIPG